MRVGAAAAEWSVRVDLEKNLLRYALKFAAASVKTSKTLSSRVFGKFDYKGWKPNLPLRGTYKTLSIVRSVSFPLGSFSKRIKSCSQSG